LGEGRSNFVRTLLDSCSGATGKPCDIYAVDASFGKNRPLPENEPKHFEIYPEHYKTALFQQFDLADDAGATKKLDYVVASHSISFIMNKTSLPERLLIFRNILKHTKPGGILVFWPCETGYLGNIKEAMNVLRPM
jgi:hypothetical protein